MVNKIFYYVLFEKYASKFYRNILKSISPKCLIEVYTPNHQIALLNTIAHELKIPIIDIQHGAIGKYEPIMYSYYKKRKYDHLSDYIFTFGEYWTKKRNFHIDKEHLIPVGVPFLERYVKRTIVEEKEQNTIVIISQTRYSKLFMELANILQDDFDISKENRILLKLHPYEYNLYQKGFYTELEEKGVIVEAGLEKHVYEYFENALCVIGINLTALFEALAFNKRIFVYNNKYGIEDLLELSQSVPFIQFFECPKDVQEQIKSSPFLTRTINTQNIFSNNSMERTLNAIEQIKSNSP